MSLSAQRSRTARFLPAAVAVVTTVLLLGPALRPGVTIAYDMPWSPVPTFSPFVLGVGTPAPRAVPGDAVVVALGALLGAGLAQALVLGGMLTAAALGVVALLRRLRPSVGTWPAIPAVIFAIWNPFVIERLAIGQWVVLLGYAVLPWVLVCLLSPSLTRWLPALAGLASLGGANPWSMVALVLVPALLALSLGPSLARLVARPRAPARTRPSAGPSWRIVAATIGTLVGSAAVWALPSLVSAPRADPAGGAAFGPSADTPLGVIGSLLSGGGFWNSASHPAPRDHLFLAAVAAVFTLVCGGVAVHGLGRRAPGVLAGAGLSGLLVLASVTGVAASAWSLVLALPGGGLLRDTQKYLALWPVLAAVGAGLLAQTLLAQTVLARAGSWRAPVAVALALAPLALLPTSAWGLGGRLSAVEVPAGLSEGAAVLSNAPAGVVGVLPWNQYRRYEWNGSRISLTLLPRLVNQVTLFDDSLPLRSGRIAGEDRAAADVTAAIGRGVAPVAALRAAGTTYIAVERRAGLAVPEDLRQAGPVLVDTPELLVVQVGQPRPTPVPTALIVGWVSTLAVWFGLFCDAVAATGKVLRRPVCALIRSRA